MIHRIYLQFPEESNEIEISDLVDLRQTQINQVLYNSSLRSAINSYRTAIKYNSGIAQNLLIRTGTIKARVIDLDNNPVFTGYVEANTGLAIGKTTGWINLEIFDNSYLLDKDINLSISWDNFKVCNPDNTEESIVHKLISLAGYEDDYINTITDLIDVELRNFTLTAGDSQYRSILDTLLYEYGYVFNLNALGQFYLYNWGESKSDQYSIEPKNIIADSLTIESVQNEFTGINIKWSELAEIEDVLLYRENTPYDSKGNRTGEMLGGGEYYPLLGFAEDHFQKYDDKWLDLPYLSGDALLENDDISLLTTWNQYLDYSVDLGITVEKEIYEAKRAQILLRNPTTEIKRLYYMDIRGDALYRKNIQESIVDFIDGSNRKEYETKYIYDLNSASNLSNYISNRLNGYTTLIKFKSRAKYSLGSIVSFTTLITGFNDVLNLSGRISNITMNEEYDFSIYTLESLGNAQIYTPITSSTNGRSSNLLFMDQLNKKLGNTPSYDEIQVGWESEEDGYFKDPQKLTNKGKIENVYGQATGLSILLSWDRPVLLTGKFFYEIQIAEDSDGDLEWKSISIDGGLGNTNSVTVAYAECFSTGKLNLDEENGIVNPTIYCFRVRVAVYPGDEDSPRGDWSDTKRVIVKPIYSGELGAGSVSGEVLNNAFSKGKLTLNTETGLWELATNSISSEELQNDSVTSQAIQANAVGLEAISLDVYADIKREISFEGLAFYLNNEPEEGDVRSLLINTHIAFQKYTEGDWDSLFLLNEEGIHLKGDMTIDSDLLIGEKLFVNQIGTSTISTMKMSAQSFEFYSGNAANVRAGYIGIDSNWYFDGPINLTSNGSKIYEEIEPDAKMVIEPLNDESKALHFDSSLGEWIFNTSISAKGIVTANYFETNMIESENIIEGIVGVADKKGAEFDKIIYTIGESNKTLDSLTGFGYHYGDEIPYGNDDQLFFAKDGIVGHRIGLHGCLYSELYHYAKGFIGDTAAVKKLYLKGDGALKLTTIEIDDSKSIVKLGGFFQFGANTFSYPPGIYASSFIASYNDSGDPDTVLSKEFLKTPGWIYSGKGHQINDYWGVTTRKTENDWYNVFGDRIPDIGDKLMLTGGGHFINDHIGRSRPGIACFIERLSSNTIQLNYYSTSDSIDYAVSKRNIVAGDGGLVSQAHYIAW
ncbi:hypothetical protein [Spirochaeta cellobiosiphila]|uniref:hypothetical protein n=1 Tax=Spirochaeta cellobiosiphila TaxID=504483 RepID=UPI0003F9B642|nr:hypothetical protein [Spirochaeta cellobiosiphila]